MAAGGKKKDRQTYKQMLNMDKARRANESMVDSVVGDEPPKSAAEESRRARGRSRETINSDSFLSTLKDLNKSEKARALRENRDPDFLYNPSKLLRPEYNQELGYKKGGKVRGCGVAQRGLTKGRMV
jgi:hypothetical protein